MAPSPPKPGPAGGRFSNRRIVLICLGAFVAMVALAYAAVPFYRAFCQATGFNGDPRRAESAAGVKALNRRIDVRFDTNVRGLPWTFTPVQTHQSIRIGATSLAYFKVKNNGSTPLTGRAAYNVTPESAATYFLKIQCFCFSDQTLPPGVEKTFPVIYYVDPKFASDPDTSPLQELTLSYTFYPAPDAKAANPKDDANKVAPQP
jgi:cytochrome c oxidase assembly protein subunit 11